MNTSAPTAAEAVDGLRDEGREPHADRYDRAAEQGDQEHLRRVVRGVGVAHVDAIGHAPMHHEHHRRDDDVRRDLDVPVATLTSPRHRRDVATSISSICRDADMVRRGRDVDFATSTSFSESSRWA